MTTITLDYTQCDASAPTDGTPHPMPSDSYGCQSSLFHVSVSCILEVPSNYVQTTSRHLPQSTSLPSLLPPGHSAMTQRAPSVSKHSVRLCLKCHTISVGFLQRAFLAIGSLAHRTRSVHVLHAHQLVGRIYRMNMI